MSGAIVTQYNDIRRVSVTVPGTATGAQVSVLVAAALTEVDASVSHLGFKIAGVMSDGTQRAALQVASPRPGAAIAATDFTTHGQGVVAGADYYEPADLDIRSYVRAPGGAAAAIVVVYVK